MVTPCHYDYFQNFYHQIHGRKRFLIFPPELHVELDLYPALHPAHRSAQVTLEPLPHSSIKRSASLLQTSPPLEALEVTLEPGDVLFIPALWFHQVETLDPLTLSVNVWSEHAEVDR